MRDDSLLQRWIAFNGVGALGIAVQLLTLACLVRGLELQYLWSTAIAVETAVLHNFFWHERWTWRDRRSGSLRDLAKRAGRFHLCNGAISMGGNLLLMRILTGWLQMDPVAANILAIIGCSFVNFAVSELYVFRKAAVATTAALLIGLSADPATAGPDESATTAALLVDLQARTVQAWNGYEQAVDARYHAAGSPFFALDAFGQKDWRAAALGGGVVMTRIDRPRPGGSEVDVPDGKIHHWIGVIFVPGTSLAAVLERLGRQAGQESQHYQDVIASKLMARDGDRYRIFLKLRRSKVVTVTYNTEHLVEYRRLTATRASARSASTRIAELDDAGTAGEREKPVGSDSGYLWRLNAYWRYEETNGGVLIECESVSLSRGVPMLLRPFVTGVVEGLARESLERTLAGLRQVLRAAPAK